MNFLTFFSFTSNFRVVWSKIVIKVSLLQCGTPISFYFLLATIEKSSILILCFRARQIEERHCRNHPLGLWLREQTLKVVVEESLNKPIASGAGGLSQACLRQKQIEFCHLSPSSSSTHAFRRLKNAHQTDSFFSNAVMPDRFFASL